MVMVKYFFESAQPISGIALLMRRIPKPGREIPKTVEERSGKACPHITKLLPANSLREVNGVAWSVQGSAMWMKRSDQPRKLSGLAPQAPDGESILWRSGCLFYNRGKSHV